MGAYLDLSFAYQILPESALAGLESSYGDSDLVRGSGEDAQMAGFYVWNNVGIALRCFATGVLGGLGSAFFLVYNGLMIGTVFGYLFAVDLGWNLVAFTAGHSAWELTGIVISGSVVPGLTRWKSSPTCARSRASRSGGTLPA